MPFSHTHRFAGKSGLAAEELDKNFTDIEKKFSGGLTTDSFKSSAAIASSKLKNGYSELAVHLRINGTAVANEGLNSTTSGWFVFGAIPYDASGGSAYTIVGITQMLYLGTGGVVTPLVGSLLYGNHTDGWTTIKAGVSATAANHQSTVTGFVTDVTPSATRPYFFVFDVTTQGVGYNDGDSFCLSIKIKSELRA